jgi:hypothetical protein
MRRALWIEMLAITALCAAGIAAVPLAAGEWGWSWDALNHHVYLGLISESPRWSLDVNAASVQSWQYPYLYWPIYRMALLPLHGAVLGALWGALLCGLIVPPVWLISHRLLPQEQRGWPGALQAGFERCASCLIGMSSLVVLSALGTTANDPLASVPVLWALAVMTVPKASDQRAAWAAALWGVSIAFKLSNALALPLLFVWWWTSPGWPLPLRRGFALGAGALAGFVVAYAPWGWQLWMQTGNPFYPFLSGFFSR